ncbi:hypothetical protein CDAR_421191 [Caerostris darwini]|uniref:Uncharacterized protein n=1 Tax=Caerostris darwini TaxID=1538125 RepID=A0AAV4WB73_9ARAC|nr:hypothetical protein CDAR_421191 [Caerostris darwini]
MAIIKSVLGHVTNIQHDKCFFFILRQSVAVQPYDAGPPSSVLKCHKAHRLIQRSSIDDRRSYWRSNIMDRSLPKPNQRGGGLPAGNDYGYIDIAASVPECQ